MANRNVVAAIIGAGVAAVVGYGAFQYQKTGDFSFITDVFAGGSRTERLERQMMRELAGTPFSTVFDKFRTSFPAEWASFLQQIDANVQAGGDKEQMHQSAQSFMTNFLSQNANNIARAEPAVLSSIVTSYRDAMETLGGENPAMCAASFNNGQMTSADTESLSPQTQTALARVTTLMMDAIVSGRANPQTYSPVQDYEMRQVFTAMNNSGVSESALIAMGNGTLASAPVTEQCTVGRALFRALADMPADFRARFMSFSMAQAAASGGLQ